MLAPGEGNFLSRDTCRNFSSGCWEEGSAWCVTLKKEKKVGLGKLAWISWEVLKA